MKKFFLAMLIALLCSGAIYAQFSSTEGRVQRVISIKNGNLNGILRTIQALLPNTSVLVTNSDSEHLILSGPKDAVAGFEEIIKQLDVVPVAKKNIETTVYMVVASLQASNGAATIPPELEPVVKQLKGVFNYKSFRLLDSFVLRSRDTEKAVTNGFLSPLDTALPAGTKINYQFQYNRVSLDGTETSRVIRYDGLRLNIKVPVSGVGSQFSYVDAGISTDVDVPEGKKVVVGKTSTVEGADSALILVISAKVVD
jgi:type II secretory pathway component GspD/PulD (secretin)